ncbi:type I restriction endonuclease subunit R [Sphaerisporangium sp. NPDC049003]|uniref:type I restriction endonuclease subunit R n=1 Tax=Sphaerisporangium sp. NPDC049003 TaxID=3364517 RepID=UPI0037186807
MADLEYKLVERPLCEQLKAMGWKHLEGAEYGAVIPTKPFASGRTTFDEVILEDRLRDAIYKINLGQDGKPWLDEARITSAVNALSRIPASSLLEANQQATELLIKGTVVDGVPGWEGGKGRTVHFIDWKTPANNEFTVVNQFRVNIPGTQGRPIIPDVVLFVNGIPLVVVECKEPRTTSLGKAVDQLLDYAEQRPSEVRTGNQKLFHTVQLTIVTSGEEAKLGTFTARLEHYVPWRDPYPLTKEELAEERGKTPGQLSRQEILTSAVLRPGRLLDIMHNYVAFLTTDQGKTIKVAPRYQQFRAVDRTVRRLRTGKTRARDGVNDRRGGIIWHTQGSGKSLTMTFLVRKLRSTRDLANAKVVVVTDRTQLQGQLSETMRLSGEQVDVAKSAARAKTILAKHGPGVVFVMIQKNQDDRTTQGMAAGTELGEVNADESIVVLIDEAHRSHTAALGANLREALPNAARIGFTGTPIMTRKGQRKTSVELFGSFIDTYRLKEAEEDGVIVPILYEGHTVTGAIRDGRDLDEVFEEDLEELSDEERDRLQRRYATKGQVSSAEELIAAKARHMLRHYVGKILPEGFKAQVVARGREETIRYREALLAARDDLVRQIERLPEKILATPSDELKPRHALLVNAARHLDVLKRMDFVPVISAGEKDDSRYTEWTDQAKQERRIQEFTKPYGESGIGFVIVKSMLLTGFDAPIEQVMYLDRSLQDAELLQAVARVNRTSDGKEFGYVVDYQGVAKNLLDALRVYARDFDDAEAQDVESALKDPSAEIAKLEPQRDRLRLMFRDPADIEGCVQTLEDEELRARFTVALTRFLKTVNTVLPDPAAKPYLEDAKRFGVIKITATRRYRDDEGRFDPAAYGAKIRELIDEHVTSLGIEQKLPPVALTAPDFAQKVEALPGPRARASEMEHAIRHHITVHRAEDPARYQRLSERLEEILKQLATDWEQQVLALSGLIAEMTEEQPQNPFGLSQVESALYGLILQETATSADSAQDEHLADVARKIHRVAADSIHITDFWTSSKQVDQEDFRRHIFRILFDEKVCEMSALDHLAGLLFDVVKSNRQYIPQG